MPKTSGFFAGERFPASLSQTHLSACSASPGLVRYLNPKFGGIEMKLVWFKPWGWIYRPISWQGVLIVLLTLAFCVQVFLAIDRNSHSVSDTLYGIFPFVVPALMVLNWIASKTSKDE